MCFLLDISSVTEPEFQVSVFDQVSVHRGGKAQPQSATLPGGIIR